MTLVKHVKLKLTGKTCYNLN